MPVKQDTQGKSKVDLPRTDSQSKFLPKAQQEGPAPLPSSKPHVRPAFPCLCFQPLEKK